jgi:hypothetical protein
VESLASRSKLFFLLFALGFSSLAYAETPTAKGKGNAEVLHEIYQVVLLHEPKSKSEFGSWLDVLNQGASFEGVYNGFTHSDEYGKLERSGATANLEALKSFTEELSGIEAQLEHPTAFDELKLKKPLDSPESIAKYQAHFSGTNIFRLKRVLGEEALKLVWQKRKSPEALASWYSKWVVHMASRNIDFGLPLRNKPDEKFHSDWAMKTPIDRIEWEVLNRLHRMLNFSLRSH